MHVIERLRERYGLDATEADIEAARLAIVAGRSVLLTRDFDAERHLVRVKGVVVWAVVSARTKRFITVLPSDLGASTRLKKRPDRRRPIHGAGSRRKREGARPAAKFDAREWL